MPVYFPEVCPGFTYCLNYPTKTTTYNGSRRQEVACTHKLKVHAIVHQFEHVIMPPTVGKEAISVAFVRPIVRLSVRPSVANIANNSRRQMPSMPKFGRKVPHVRCDSHTSFKVKHSRSNSQRSELEAGGGIPCRSAATLLVRLCEYVIIWSTCNTS